MFVYSTAEFVIAITYGGSSVHNLLYLSVSMCGFSCRSEKIKIMNLLQIVSAKRTSLQLNLHTIQVIYAFEPHVRLCTQSVCENGIEMSLSPIFESSKKKSETRRTSQLV